MHSLDNLITCERDSMNFLKAFDCIPYELLIAKPSSYGFNGNALRYIFTYLKNRKQCVLIKNVSSDFKDIILGGSAGFNNWTSFI